MNKLRIRQAVLADIDALAVLFDGYRQFYEQPGDIPAAKKFLLERMNHGESVLFIAHDGEEPVGFTQLYPSFSSVSIGRIFILNDLFVSASGRRKGVGAGLLAAAGNFAREMGALRLALSTAHSNTRAQALYEAQGWERDDDFFYVYPIGR
jgi:GNAT superfamily N-acetyltransferase